MIRGSYRFAYLVLLILLLASCRTTVKDIPLPETIEAAATTSGSVTVRVTAAADDAEQNNSTGGVALNNSRLPFGSTGETARTAAMRFRNVTIPKGATITSAALEFKASASDSGTITLTFVGEAADNTPGYTTTANALSSRPKTNANAPWRPNAWTSGQLYRYTALKGIVQEIVSRPGWQSGNALAIQVSGTGLRRAVPFDNSAANAPKLIVSYTTTTNPPPPPPTSGPCDTLTDNVTPPWQSQSLSPSSSIDGKASQTAGTGTFDVCGVDEGYLATGFDEAMHYVSQPLDGNGMITVKVTSLEPGAEAGVFLRGISAYQPEDAAAGLFFKPGTVPQLESYGQFSAYSLGNSVRLDKRAIADAAAALGSSRKSNVTAEMADLAGVLRDTLPDELFSAEEPMLSPQANALSAPQWLRIKRVNQTVTAYSSSNGTTWQEVGSTSLAMVRNIKIGFTAASGTLDKLALAHFENVTVEPLEPFVDVPAQLPYPWKRQDIGLVGTPGSSSSPNDDDAFVVSGSGNGTAGADVQHFVYQDLSGDGTLVAEIPSLDSGPAANLQAGLMLRKTLDAGSPYGFLSLSLDGTASFKQAPLAPTSTETSQTFQKDIATDAVASVFNQLKLSQTATAQPDRWLMLTREGGTLIGYVSDNNETWRQVGTATLTLDETVYLGLAVNSSSSALATATFQNVSVSPDVVVPVLEPDPEPTPTVPEPWQNTDIGSLATPGSASFENDTFQLGAAAAGLGQQSDALHYVYQPLAQDGSLTVHVNGLADDAKVGLSIRSALSPDAEHTSLWLQGTQGVPSFVARKSGGVSGNSNFNDALADAVSEQARTLMGRQAAEALVLIQASDDLPAASHWLRLTRKGNAVGAFTSADGQTWQQVGYETFDVASGASIGFWVAGNTGSVSATLDNVSFSSPIGELYNPGEPIEILLNPWSKATIGSGSGETGVRNDNALYSLSASGGTDTAPVTEFMYRQERSGDALYVSVNELHALEADGAAGLMIRDGLATGSSYAFLKATPKGIVLETKANGGVSETLVQPARDTLPLWLRIASVGNTVTVYQTQDVVTWDAIGSAQVPLGSTRYLGIAARSSGGEVTGAFTRPRLIHAGDDTLTGSDSDGNGVRDDVQHYISVNYPSSGQAPIRDAFIEVAQEGRAILTGSGAGALEGYNNAQDAARQLLGEANEYQLGLLESELFDTPDRLLRFLTAANAATQSTTPNRASDQEMVGQQQSDGTRLPGGLTLEEMAEGCQTGASPNKVSKVLFSNGIWAGNTDATLGSVNALESLIPDLEAVDPSDDEFTTPVGNAFAQGDGISDLHEIATLKINEALATQWQEQISDPWDSNEVLKAYYNVGEGEVRTMAQSIALGELVMRYDDRSVEHIAQTVQMHAAQYKELLLAGERVFVVAHSQGTLLANAAKRLLAQDPEVAGRLDSMRILHVASLADHVEDVNPNAYVTDGSDTAVRYIDNFYAGNVLPANERNLGELKNPWYAVSDFEAWNSDARQWAKGSFSHDFAYYLEPGSATREAILNKLREQVRTTPHQCFEDQEPEDPGEDPGTTPPIEEEPDDPSEPEDGSAESFGDPHMNTFDDLFLSIQSVGEFILARSLDDDFEVQARFAKVNDRLSANAALALNVAGDEVGIYTQEGQPPSVFINGEEVDYGDEFVLALTLPNGGQLSTRGTEAMVIWPDGSLLRTELMVTNGRSTAEIVGSVNITIPPARAGRIEGILGNFDGNWANDIRTRGGQVLSNPSIADIHTVFAESWRITQEESLFVYPEGKNTASFTDRSAPSAYVTVESLDPSVRSEAEQTCRAAGVIDARVLRACILDVAATGDPAWAAIAVGLDPNTVDMAIAPLTFVMLINETREVGAVVSGSVANRQGVSWQAEAGRISGSGNAVTFTAPNEPGEYRLTATLDEDPSVSATATAIVLHSLVAPGDVRFSLSWDAEPRDLDSHLWLPQEYACEVYHGARGDAEAYPFATLDIDDTDGFGPEVITIQQRYNTGVYEYAIYNYSGTGSFSSPNIQVEMYTSQGRVKTFTPPSTGSGIWWHVLSVKGSTGEVIEVNEVVSSFNPYASSDNPNRCVSPEQLGGTSVRSAPVIGKAKKP